MIRSVCVLIAAHLGTFSTGCPAPDAEQLGLFGAVRSVRTEYSYVLVESRSLRETKRFVVHLQSFDSNRRMTTDWFYKEDSSIDYKWEYKYDAQGFLTDQVLYKEDNAVHLREVFSYDGAARVCKVSSFHGDGTPYSSIERRTYDKENHELEQVQYGKDGLPAFKTVFRYDKAGRLVEEDRYFFDKNHESLTSRRVLDYKERGPATRERVYERHGKIPGQDIVYSYEFDDRGNWTRRNESWLEEGDTKASYVQKKVTYRTIAYYD